jgi:hypothetical protein
VVRDFLRDYLKSLREDWPIHLFIIVVCGGASFLVTRSLLGG